MLNLAAIADDDQGMFGGDVFFFGDLPESTEIHGADPDVKFLETIFLDDLQNRPLEGSRNPCQTGADLPHGAGLIQPWDEKMPQLGERQRT